MPDAPPAAARPIENAVIRVHDLRHRYGRREALRGVSFEVASGEIFGVLGPNGGGKSTLFRILSTMIPATAGTVELLGHNPAEHLTGVRRELGVVFQSPSLDPMLTARENLRHQGHLYGIRGARLHKRMTELLDRVELADRSEERVSRFSGGMRRRLEIAKALLHGPRLLILDEPSTGLDPGARRTMWDHLRRLRDTQGVTLVFTTHLMDEAENCDRLALLDEGRLVALDTPGRLKRHVGGDVITVETDDPGDLARAIHDRFGLEASTTGGRVRLEREQGHEFLATLVEAFPGRVRSISMGRPTLEDVFLDLTGHRFEDAEAAASAGAGDPERKPRRRGRRR